MVRKINFWYINTLRGEETVVVERYLQFWSDVVQIFITEKTTNQIDML